MSDVPSSPYVLLERLGEGGVGEVHLARDTRLGRRVALKFLRDDVASQETARERFVQEAKAAAAIDHPFVCKVFESGEFEGRTFIAMEYVRGESLDTWLDTSPSFEAKLQIAKETAEALQEAHERGFLHRDLKPSNIMVTAGGHPKVLDFGLAKQLIEIDGDPGAALTAAGQISGTFEYLSPEQAVGDPLDPRSDVFSLGIILYEMFVGVHPFRRDTSLKSALAIMTHPAPPIQATGVGLPTELALALEQMLHKDPSGRTPSMGAVRQALECLATTPAPVRQISYDSVAVLPFSRMSPDPEDDYFVDGMTEEIITRLSKVSGLKVISRTSVMRYRDLDTDLRTVGAELGVSTVVEGSVRRASNRVRIAARLIAVEADLQLWGESYDRDLDDVFSVQSEVSNEVAQALRRKLSPSTRERLGTHTSPSLEAYHQYLRGRFSLHKLTPEGIRTGIAHFSRALEVDADYALAHAGIATCNAYAGHFGYIPIEEAFPEAKRAAKKALDSDDSLAEAHAALGLVALFYEWDWRATGGHFERSLALDPNFATGHLQYSWYHLAMDRGNDALAAAEKAVELDPLSAFAHTNLGWTQFYFGLHEESLGQYDRAIELEPDDAFVKDVIAGTYMAMGRLDEAIALLETAINPAHLAWAFALAGESERAREVIGRLLDPSNPTPPSAFDLAMTHLIMGELDEGFRFIEKAMDHRDSRLTIFANHPFLKGVRSDPRMLEIVHRLGLDAEAL
jgi:serine/threonine-protein kinase